MFRPFVLLLSAAIPFALVGGARAEDTPKDVVAQAIKAHGGAEVIGKKAGRASNKGKITIPGVGEVEFTQEVSYMLPDKVRESMELKIANQNVSVLTLIGGGKAVIEVNGKAIDLPDAAKEAIKDAGYLMKVGRLASLVSEKGFELDTIGEDKVEGKAVVGVRVSSKGHKDVSLYFDKKTHLLAKMEYRTADPMTGNELVEERIVAEYGKNRDGVPVPKKVIVKRDGKAFLEAEVLEITFLDTIDEGEFKK